MVKFTEDMKRIAEKTPIFIMATASREGKPNGIPIGLAKILSDDEILIADNYMHKTRQNIEENPVVAVSFWNQEDRYGYQFKGKARVETSGKTFDEATPWLEAVAAKRKAPKFTPKALIVVKVEEIYYVGAKKDSGKNLA